MSANPSRPAAIAAFFAITALLAPASAQTTAPGTPAESLPVREVTVFKDGHAFVLHEGEAAMRGGEVRLDGLPEAIIGTFWPYAAEADVNLVTATAAREPVERRRNARTTSELLRANLGAEVIIQEADGLPYTATILDLPEIVEPPAAAPAALQPSGGPREVTPVVRYAVLRTFEGTKVVNIERIRDVTYKTDVVTEISTAQERGVLRLRLERGGQPAAGTTKIGMVYLQRGLRWIPSYRVDLDGAGNASVRLQATLLNELRDIENVRVNLVIGVPTFKFKHTLDPMALQASATQLSQYFQEPGGRTAYAFSNAIMAQQARMGDYSQGQPQPPSAVDDIADASQNEDLFVFTVENITLWRGEAMTLPVGEFKIPYENVYALDVPFTPPGEIACNAQGSEQEELMKLMHAPKVVHRVRLSNKSRQPLTTAPALLLREGRVLSQGLMTYTSIGGSCDLDVTTAMDVRVTKREREADRVQKALNWNGHEYMRVVLDGKICLTNYRNVAVEVEVKRRVLGRVDGAGQKGEIEQTNVLEGDFAFEAARPYWWHWYNWPNWWSALNGVGSIRWKVKLEPGESVELTYQSSYYWR